MAERPRPKVIAAIACGIFAIAALAIWLPALGKARPVALSTPGAPAITAIQTVPLVKGKDICVDSVPLNQSVRAIRVQLEKTGGRPRPPIEVKLLGANGGVSGGGRVSGGEGKEGAVTIPARWTASEEALGYVCLRSPADYTIDLAGSAEFRTRSRSNTLVGNQSIDNDLTLTVLERSRNLGSRLAEVFERAATFKPGGATLLSVLALVLLVGLPVGLIAVLRSAADEDQRPRD